MVGAITNPRTKIIQFADDTKLYRQIVDAEDRNELQKGIDDIVKWSGNNKFEQNAFTAFTL